MKRILVLIAVISSLMFPQTESNHLMQEALKQMQTGKYGEAIDLLNRYISAEPQDPQGYNLRGLAHEKRAMYEMAVYDFKTARKLAPKNREISTNLSRTTESWYKLLYNKIEGHKREIAISPSVPVNYLEIGKCYKNLGEWGTAEEWYDKYLEKEEASPDEIIRYTEILAKNNHISKGEPILKKYVEKYPDDQRLWSRYGYFTLWMGKKKIAVDAFEHSLAIKPYFQEALDGLDLAKGKRNIYTVNDTSYVYSRTEGMVPRVKKQEYPIDRYYRTLKKFPKDNETRFKLVKELIKAHRYEEAFIELEILSSDSLYNEKYEKYISDVKTKKDSLVAIRVKSYIKKIQDNPSDKATVTKLATHYAGVQDYESAMAVLMAYISKVPEKDAADLRFMYAKYAAWDYRFRESIDQLEILLKYYPDDPDYQLLRAQIAVWTDQDLNTAEVYLTEVLKKNPDNLSALIASASLKIKQQQFAAARVYIDKAYSLDPQNKDVEAVKGNYEMNLASYELYKILDEARELVQKNDCNGAIKKYDEYLAKVTAPSRLEKVEYASLFLCTEDYPRAISIYDELLAEEYDFDIAVFRAKAYLWGGDSAKALYEFKKLASEKPEDFEANFFYGVSLASNQYYSDADDVYDKLLTETTDSSKIKMIKEAQGWLPKGRLIGNFPTYLAIAPHVGFYDDNQSYTFNTLGAKLEFGITSYLAAGASFASINVHAFDAQRNLLSAKGNLFINFTPEIRFAGGIGSLKTKDIDSKTIYDAQLQYEMKDRFVTYLYYEHNDSRMLLYSPYTIDSSINVNFAKLGVNYKSKSGIRAYGYFSYLDISDDNEGNDFMMRIGKEFEKTFSLGYEYQYLNYSKNTTLYWSPQNYDSHCLWGDWDILRDDADNFKINLGGRIGYITQGDFWIREIAGDLSYKPLPHFVLVGKVTAGSSYRFDTSYNYVSAVISAYWGIF